VKGFQYYTEGEEVLRFGLLKSFSVDFASYGG
jgi:hypothetical protein